MIIKEEGTGYNEYMRSLFKAYLTSSNKEFTDAISSERRDWIQGKVKVDYSYLDLMELARLTYNNLVDDESWIKKEAKKEHEKNYLTLATELIAKYEARQNDGGDNGNGNRNNNGNRDNQGPRTFQKWRYDNPDNAATKQVRGTTMNWCTNDCHDKRMWCRHETCMDRADYASNIQKKHYTQESISASLFSNNKSSMSNDFRISLSALMSAEDYPSLDDQFF